MAIEVHGIEESGVYRKAVTPKIRVPDREAVITAKLNSQPYDFAEISTDGNYLLDIEAVDQVGNSSKRSISFIIDTTPPVSSVTASAPKFTFSKSVYLGRSSLIELSSTDTGHGISGVSKIQYHFGNLTEWKDYRNPIEVNLLDNGPHMIHYRSIDNAGNIETARNLGFILDSNYPSSRIEIGTPLFKNNDGKTYVSSATDFSISATDEGSGIEHAEYRIDGGEWLIYRESFRLDIEGEHKIEFRSKDRVGNIEQIQHVTIMNDSTPPISNLTLNGRRMDTADILYVNRPLKLSISASDIHSGIKKSEYRIDQESWQSVFPFDVDANKNHLISYRSSDALDNQEIIKTLSVQVDKTPPVTKISLTPKNQEPAKDVQVVNDITFFILEATDTGSGAVMSEYRVDSGEWLRYEPFTIQQGGKHLIEYRSSDKAGNTESPKSLSVLVDTFPPSSVITVNNRNIGSGESLFSKNTVAVALSASDKETRIKSIEYRLNDGGWTPYQPFSISAEGAHILEFRSKDYFDNTESTKFIKIVIDNTPPFTTIVYGEPNQTEPDQVQISTRTVISLNVIEELSGPASSEYRIIGKGERQGSEPFSITTPGEYEIRYWSIDKAGNRETEKIAKVKVAPPPQPAIANTDEKSFPSDKQKNAALSGSRATDSEIPDSIRMPVEPPQPKNDLISEDRKPVLSKPDKGDDEAIYLSDYISNQGDQSFSFGNTASRTNTKELLAVGGINALIIAIIFLIL